MTSPAPAPSRRSLAIALTVVAAVAAAALVVSALSPRSRPRTVFASDGGVLVAPAPPPALMAAIMPGVKVGELEVVGARLLDEGAFRVELSAPTDPRVSVDITRLDPSLPPPPVHTAKLGLYLAAGDPATPLPEPRRRALEALAAMLSEAEGKGTELPPGLKTITEVRSPGQPVTGAGSPDAGQAGEPRGP